MNIRIRLAEASDIPLLRELIRASVRGLQAGDHFLIDKLAERATWRFIPLPDLTSARW